ncbi:MAG: hypothetical protein N7Q72_02585, partial [Spiroplasma sp. Tabriz.8]|nr:hypothetical protein [Spiroplasma sp. Tabriz.8]
KKKKQLGTVAHNHIFIGRSWTHQQSVLKKILMQFYEILLIIIIIIIILYFHAYICINLQLNLHN